MIKDKVSDRKIYKLLFKNIAYDKILQYIKQKDRGV